MNPTPAVEAEAAALFWELADNPMTMEEIQRFFGWKFEKVRSRLRIAREHVCVLLDAAIPRAVSSDGYRYRVIDGSHVDGPALQRSTIVAVGDAETRLKSIHRVAAIGMTVLDGRTRHAKAAKIMEFRVRQAMEELAFLDS